jgi:hypothetical protein
MRNALHTVLCSVPLSDLALCIFEIYRDTTVKVGNACHYVAYLRVFTDIRIRWPK